ncbi:hypothetical protein N7462_008293 [Penicillium macrosclerotiorum]|uniref:uncharacterized protein n=1 Tax=Penicillium macrosclerotiorum TaxID=303699 RepID=UPI0025482FD6|nr:uncharacterized protein N7462_008293 [Penicillium macrosclerotiorum]KAJ5675396.1 hypothetical protein N7462_008293 [Penicillium macrosclerotiorum]
MGMPQNNDPAPDYEDLFEQQPSNMRTGYARVAQADETIDLEHGAAHQHSASPAIPLGVRPADAEHVHCEVCDRQLERRENREKAAEACRVVSRTFILITLFLMVFGIVAVVSIAKRPKHD